MSVMPRMYSAVAAIIISVINTTQTENVFKEVGEKWAPLHVTF